MKGRSRTSLAALAALLVGGAVLFLASAEYLRVIAATVLLTGIALGVFAIVTPEFVARDEEDPAGD